MDPIVPIRPRTGVDAAAPVEHLHRIDPDRERERQEDPRRRKPRRPPAAGGLSRDEDGRLHVDVQA